MVMENGVLESLRRNESMNGSECIMEGAVRICRIEKDCNKTLEEDLQRKRGGGPLQHL
jgi:hypothetical protein